MKEKKVLFYILTEFQSEVNFTMPFRLLQYMIGIWNDIWDNTTKQERERKNFRLPVIVPIVIYTGSDNWTVRKNFKELLDESTIFKQVIDLPYYLIDVNRYDPEDLINLSNEIGAIFLFDQNYDILELKERYDRVSSVIKNLDPDRYQKFINWFGKAILSQFSIPNLDDLLIQIKNSSPEEVDTMISNLSNNVRRGLEQAELIGLEKGMEKGLEKGLEKGREEGVKKGLVQVAKNMLRKNLALHDVVDLTGLPLCDVLQLADQIKTEN